MTRLATILLSVIHVWFASYSIAQTEPLSVSFEGTLTSVDTSVWGFNAGDRYTITLDLNLDVSSPRSVGPSSSTWDSFGVLTFEADGQQVLTTAGPCDIRIHENQFGTNQHTVEFTFSETDPLPPDRLITLLLFSKVGAPVPDVTFPPTTDLINALNNSFNASNIDALIILDDFVTETATGNIDTVAATGFNGELPPVITQQPTPSQIVNPTDPIALAIAADGPDLAYQWHRDGVPLVDNAAVSGANTDTLTIVARSTDTGIYECVVSNPTDTVTSDPAMVGVRNLCPADQNFDGAVTPTDFNAWINNFNMGC